MCAGRSVVGRVTPAGHVQGVQLPLCARSRAPRPAVGQEDKPPSLPPPRVRTDWTQGEAARVRCRRLRLRQQYRLEQRRSAPAIPPHQTLVAPRQKRVAPWSDLSALSACSRCSATAASATASCCCRPRWMCRSAPAADADAAVAGPHAAQADTVAPPPPWRLCQIAAAMLAPSSPAVKVFVTGAGPHPAPGAFTHPGHDDLPSHCKVP